MFQYDSLKTDLPLNEIVMKNIIGCQWNFFYSWYNDDDIKDAILFFPDDKSVDLKFYSKEKKNTTVVKGLWTLDNANVITMTFKLGTTTTIYRCMSDAKMIIGMIKNNKTINSGICIGMRI